MNTFADDLATRITASPVFWADIGALYAVGLHHIIPGLISAERSDANRTRSTQRLLEAASILAQTTADKDRALAQTVAVYAALTTDLGQVRQIANGVITALGNHPGAARLRSQFQASEPSLSALLSNRLLGAINTITVGGTPYALTDFQLRVWQSLSTLPTVAVSAPTSAGKSFVVLEYLCAEAVRAPAFNAIFIAPTRALLGEVHAKITKRLGEHSASIRVSTVPSLDQQARPKQIFVLTQERLQVLLAAWEGTADLVVVDEAQGIGDDSRGMILQDCLEILRSRSAATRFLFLAPGATGFQNLSRAIDISNVHEETTELSPVIQNRIVVDPIPNQENRLNLTLLTEERAIHIGQYAANRGFAHDQTRLAAVALELGRYGGSLVYGTGPADAEKTAGRIASDLDPESSEPLKELSSFIKKHVHKKYSLAAHVLKGVGFHYGKMPSLLREALEEGFQNGHLKYLVCTTTLFQGVNLPARNVFIDTPTRGRGDELDAAALWNFAGRAGRLGHEIVGNVFLVGYGAWEQQSFTTRAQYSITPSFRKTVTQDLDAVLSRLREEAPPETRSTPYGPADAAAGLLISRAARGTLRSFLARTLNGSVADHGIELLASTAEKTLKELGLPEHALATNWTVNAFGQSRLLRRFREKIREHQVDELIPVFPSSYTSATYSTYVGVFSRINKYLLGSNNRKFANRLAATALAWMRGIPLPRLIDDYIKYSIKNSPNEDHATNIDAQVRNVFAFVEDVLRFKYVQLGRAYVDLLRFALEEAELDEQAKSIYDFPLALELGVSTIAGAAFIELGLSRITASLLEGLIPDSNPTSERVRQWLLKLDPVELKLSRVVINELTRKGLRPAALETP